MTIARDLLVAEIGNRERHAELMLTLSEQADERAERRREQLAAAVKAVEVAQAELAALPE